MTSSWPEVPAPVSRETDLPAAGLLAHLFGQQEPEIRRYAGWLAGPGVERGLIGPRELARLWTRHILNCAVIAPLFSESSTVCDLGSGAGLPGVVLALARPDLKICLVEPRLRRAEFLQEVARALAPQVTVIGARGQDVQSRFDYVTARAVAPLGRLAEISLPMCGRNGQVVAIKGANANSELAAAAPVLSRLGAGRAWIEQYGMGVVQPPTTVIRLRSR